jgi:hypothetical protein
MPELMTEMVGGEAYHYYPLGKHVVRAVGVWGGGRRSNTRASKSPGRLNGWPRVNGSRTLARGIVVASRTQPFWKPCA